MLAAPRDARVWRFDRPFARNDGLNNRFGRHQRLTTSEQFAAVFSAKISARTEHLAVYARANDLEEGRLGLTVGRRLSSRAVVRNYMKRFLRELFRRAPDCFRGMDWVVAPRRAFDHDSRVNVEMELLSLVEKLQRRWRASSSS
jgi:ribonuclease P protein component